MFYDTRKKAERIPNFGLMKAEEIRSGIRDFLLVKMKRFYFSQMSAKGKTVCKEHHNFRSSPAKTCWKS